MDNLVVIGTIVAPHGVRGDIRILPQTERPEQFLEHEHLLLADGRVLHIDAARFHKRMVLVKCAEINTMNEAEAFRGQEVFVMRTDLPPLAEGEYYVADLLGSEVVDPDGKKIGVLKDVVTTGSNDVYVIRGLDNKDILLPALKKHVKEINPAAHKIVAELPEWTDEA